MTQPEREEWPVGQPSVVQAPQDPPVVAADKQFGTKLRAWRLARGIDVDVVAQMLDARASEVQGWENGVGLPDDRTAMGQAYGWMQGVVGEPHQAMLDETGRLVRYTPAQHRSVRDMWARYVAQQRGRVVGTPGQADRPPLEWEHRRRSPGQVRPRRPHWGVG